MPDVGDRLLLFLVPIPPKGSRAAEAGVTHIVQTLDGILYIEDDGTLVTSLQGEGRPAHSLNGKTIDDAKAAI